MGRLRLPLNFIQIDENTPGFQAELRKKIQQNLQNDVNAQQLRAYAIELQGIIKQIQSQSYFNEHWSKMAKATEVKAENLKMKVDKELVTFKTRITRIYYIIQEMLGILRGEKVTYAIYLEIDGKQHRISIDDIPVDNFKINSRGNLLFNFSKDEFLKLEQETGHQLDIAAHYADFFSFVCNTYYYQKKAPLANRYYNRGVIAEAFENDLVPNENEHNVEHTWEAKTVWSWMNDAADDATAWYVQGDVGNIQVKNITSGALRVASISSIQHLSEILVKFVNIDPISMQGIVDELMRDMVLLTKNRNVGDQSKRYIEETLSPLMP